MDGAMLRFEIAAFGTGRERWEVPLLHQGEATSVILRRWAVGGSSPSPGVAYGQNSALGEFSGF